MDSCWSPLVTTTRAAVCGRPATEYSPLLSVVVGSPAAHWPWLPRNQTCTFAPPTGSPVFAVVTSPSTFALPPWSWRVTIARSATQKSVNETRLSFTPKSGVWLATTK